MEENDEQTDKIDDTGKKTDKPLAADGEVLSDYDKAVELVKRREEVTKIDLEVLAKKEKLAANELLSGTAGGHVESKKPVEESPKEYKDRVMSGNANG